MKKEIIETVTKVIDICDICKNKEAECSCDICKRVLCHGCRTFHNFSKYVDYEGTFCQQCWDVGTLYRKLENEAEEAYDVVMEDIRGQWKKEATDC